MTRKKAIFGKTAAVLFAAACAVFAGIVPAGADVNASSVKVTKPTQSQVLAGTYEDDGTPTGFKVTISGQATTTCSSGWQTIKFTVSGPSGTQVFNVAAPSTETWSGNAPSQWDTLPLLNGVYTVRLDVVEKDTLALACKGQSGSNYITAKVANPATAPEWYAPPSAAADGSARVTLRWKKNSEDDVREYRIVRTGPDGTKIAAVSAASPSVQGCSVASGVYLCEDKDFPADYTGTYTYALVTMRERPSYNSSESNKIDCITVAKPCVGSAGSAFHDVSLVAPTPTPEPTDQPTQQPTPGQSPTPTKKPVAVGGTGGSSGGGLSFGGSGGGFYSGTYSETLPYQPKTLILGGGKVPSSPEAAGYQGEVVSETAPDYRTIMLPVAGGLLAFLSAAHVRRLLLHL